MEQVAKQENKVLIERVINLLNAGFHGGAWHGPSLLEAVKGISPKQASFKVATVHTIAELVYHITSWRLFALKRLQGDTKYQIDTPQKDFGQNPSVDQVELETFFMELSLSHDELVKELSSKTDVFLDEIVPGAEYNYYTLIHGIIHHDIYHTGQINILKKMSVVLTSYEEEEADEYSSRYFDDGLGDAFTS